MFVREHLTVLANNVVQEVLRQLDEELMLLYGILLNNTTSSPVCEVVVPELVHLSHLHEGQRVDLLGEVVDHMVVVRLTTTLVLIQ